MRTNVKTKFLSLSAIASALLIANTLKAQVCTLSLGINVTGNSAQATAWVIPNGDTSGVFVWNLYGPISNTSSSSSSVITNVNHVNFNSLAPGTYDLCVQAFSTSCSNYPSACQSFTIPSSSSFCIPTIQLTYASGSTYAFSLTASGGTTSTYYWFWNGPTSGSTTTGNAPTLSLNLTTPGVYNVCGYAINTVICQSYTSSCITVTVTNNSSFCIPTLNVISSSGSSFNFSLSAPVSNNAIYYWSWSGPSSGNTSSGNSPTVNLNLSPAGVYWVCAWAVDSTACNAYTSSCISVTTGVTALFTSSFNDNLINLYPIPFSNYINVTLQNESSYTLTIFDVNGRKIFNTTLNGNFKKEYTLQLSDLPKGIYTIVLYNENTKYSRRIIKE